MCQTSVERVIGLLATDEALRRRFIRDPEGALRGLIEQGVELSSSELQAIARIDAGELAHFADAIDPRLQKADLQGEAC